MDKTAWMATPQTGVGEARVAISADTLTRLISEGALCAADLRCLDPQSRTLIKKLCLCACRRSFCHKTIAHGDRIPDKLSGIPTSQPVEMIASSEGVGDGLQTMFSRLRYTEG